MGLQGSKDNVLNNLHERIYKPRSATTFPQSVAGDGRPPDDNIVTDTSVSSPVRATPNESSLKDHIPPGTCEPVVEMEDVVIKYGEKRVLGDWTESYRGEVRAGLRWTVQQGERWGVFGPNGRHETRP